MKKSCLTVGLCLACYFSKAAAGSPPGFPFEARDVQLKWSAPTNHLPSGLWVYRSTPQKFSLAVVSNAMRIGGFTLKDKAKPPREPGEKADNTVTYFADKKETKHLGIYPRFGWIEYADSTARASMKDPVVGVPSEEESLRMALRFAHLLGIDRSQLAIIPGTTDLRVYREVGRRSRVDKLQNKLVTEVHSRGVFFVRRMDNVEFTGIGNAGGFLAIFGNEGKIVELQVLWRNFEPHQSYDFPSSVELMKRIKDGTTTFTNPSKDLGHVKNVTVTKVTPYYLGIGGDERQAFLYPFIGIDVSADLGTTNITFDLNCPVVLQK